MNITRDNYEEARQITKDYVTEKFDNYISGSNLITGSIPSNRDHIINTGISILETDYPQIGIYPGGGFVQAVVDNNLKGAFGNADNVNKIFIGFYVELMCNFRPNTLDYKKL
tara:strand:+ start:4304 stop:4639 length:336 start_codon:yes stop_codon:yes gene_type:complete